MCSEDILYISGSRALFKVSYETQCPAQLLQCIHCVRTNPDLIKIDLSRHTLLQSADISDVPYVMSYSMDTLMNLHLESMITPYQTSSCTPAQTALFPLWLCPTLKCEQPKPALCGCSGWLS